LPRCLLAAALLALAACGADRTPPEEALRAWVAAAELAAEARERGVLVEMISADYADARGNDRAALDRMLRLWFLRQSDIALLTKIDSIELYKDTAAQISLTVGMAATNSNVFGLSADAYRFEFDMVLDDDEWFLIGARWGEIGKELE
jgi:hypothetical protein